MIAVADALTHIINAATLLDDDTASLQNAMGRILAEDVIATYDQPPFAASAMDGYAIRFEDIEAGATEFTVIGEAPAGKIFDRAIEQNECVRIFTGGVIPKGANHVVIQEDVIRNNDDRITLIEDQPIARNIRPKGVDFEEGTVLLEDGAPLTAGGIALLAAANHAKPRLRRKPIVAILSTGDELVEPGGTLETGQIINSNAVTLYHLIKQWGGTPVYAGIASDTISSVQMKVKDMMPADIIVPVGGASVGDYDIVKDALKEMGLQTIFEKVAVRPGKPIWFGQMQMAKVLGLPGNPASALVCAYLFLRPLIQEMLGQKHTSSEMSAVIDHDLKANGPRETYMRALYHINEQGTPKVSPAPNQDSSLLKPFAHCNCFIKRPPKATKVSAGNLVTIMLL